MPTCSDYSAHIGLIRSVTGGDWTWLDSSSFSWSTWMTSEPESQDECVVLTSGDSWEGVDCDDLFYYICEINGKYQGSISINNILLRIS